MAEVLIGIESIVGNDACKTVRIAQRGDDEAAVYHRSGEHGWIAESTKERLLDEVELIDEMKHSMQFAESSVSLSLSDENVLYTNVRGRITMTRTKAEDDSHEKKSSEPRIAEIAEALGIPKTKRTAKLPQTLHLSRIIVETMSQGANTKVLDVACGRSYLGFVLSHVASENGRSITLHGIDANEELIRTCWKIANRLGLSDARFEARDIAEYRPSPGNVDIVTCLHGCDTLTDEAIRIAVESLASKIFVVPCCQREVRKQLSRHPLEWIGKYGLLEERFADTITDAFRCLVLEAKGYSVRLSRFTSARYTPKNLAIVAERKTGADSSKIAQAREFLTQFSIRPRIAVLLEELE